MKSIWIVFGASLVRFALSLYVLDMTDRADIFATVYAISNIPRLLMPLGGAFILFLLGIVPIAVILMLLDIFVISKVQKKTSNENLGKVMAIMMAVAQCAAPIGQVIYGIAFETFSASVYLPVLFISAILLVVAVVTQQGLKNEEEII